VSNQHPITPPPELVEQWRVKGSAVCGPFAVYIATQAAQWGADQELEACCEWLFREPVTHEIVGRDARYLDFELRAARRPKPPSLKEQALEAHNRMMAGEETQDDWSIVRRALEQLDD